jgi:hypothetical protein
MIERINKPEAPIPHRVEQSKQTKEDRHQQHNPRDDAEREQRKQIEGKEWKKFGRQNSIIKQIRVPRERIARCLYRGVTLHSGIGTLMVDVVWRDKKVTRGALMLVRRLEDFIKLKKLNPGDEVPENFWARGPVVEIGILQHIGTSTAIPGEEFGGRKKQLSDTAKPPGWLEKAGIVDRDGTKHWGIALLYAFLITLAVMAAVILLT